MERFWQTVLTAVICIAVSLSVARPAPQESAVQGKGDYPIIGLALGDSFSDIRARSTYKFKRTQLSKLDLVSVSTPAILHYIHTGCEFILPPALSVSATIDDLHATSVVASPHLAYLGQEEALKLASDLSELFSKSNWVLSKQYLSLDQAKAIFGDSKTPSDNIIRIREWRCGDDELYLQIERHWRQGEALARLAGAASDLYVVTVKIENDGVRAKYPGR